MLWAPRQLLAGSPLGMALVGLTLAGLAILALTAAAGYHFWPAGRSRRRAGGQRRARRRAPERYDGEDEDGDGEPGFGAGLDRRR